MKEYKIKHLGDVSKIIMGQAPHSKTYNTKKIGELLLRVNNFGNKYPTSDTYTTNPLKKSKDTDILLCVAGSCGKINFGINAAITRSIAAIRPGETLDKIFLYYFLLLKSKYFENLSTGAAQKIISKKIIEDTKIPIPKLSEQKRIVEKIDKCMEQIDKAIQNVEQNIQNAEELFQSYLNEILSQRGRGWRDRRWGDVCQFVRGPFGGSLKKSMFKESGYVVYEQKHAIHGHFNQLRYFIDKEKFNEMQRFEVNPGDLIMSCSGSIGKVVIIPEGIQKGIINQALLKLTPKDNISSEFLKYWIKSPFFQENILKLSGGAAISNVPSAKILKEIIISIPNFNTQKDVVRNIEFFESQIKTMKLTYQNELIALNELKQSILEKAFNGEL